MPEFPCERTAIHVTRLSAFVDTRSADVLWCVFFTAAFVGGALWLASEFDSGLIVIGDSHVEVHDPDPRRPLTVVFQLKNESSRPITIQAVRSGCGCGTSDTSGKVVNPGEIIDTAVTIQKFDPFSDSFIEQATVITDQQSLTLAVSGTIRVAQAVLFRPARLFLKTNAADGGCNASLIVRIPRECEGADQLTAADAWVDGLQDVHLMVEKPVESGRFFDYVVHLSRKNVESEVISGRLILATPCSAVEVPVPASRGYSASRG